MRCKKRDKGIRQPGELVLRGRFEERHRGQIDGFGGITGITNDNCLGCTSVAVHVNVLEEVSGVLEIGILFLTGEALASLGFSFVGVKIIIILRLFPPLFTMLLYPLRLRLLVGCSCSLGFSLSFSGLRCLLALYFRVFSGIPRVKDLLFQE